MPAAVCTRVVTVVVASFEVALSHVPAHLICAHVSTDASIILLGFYIYF